MREASHTLFVTWDGPAQNYMESLFFPIFAHAQCEDLRIDVLQFTWASDEQVQGIQKSAAQHGLYYEHVPTIARPKKIAVPLSILMGAKKIVSVAKQRKIDTLMPRSIIPAAMCLLAIRLNPELKLVFDADGLMADERVDFAGWRASGVMYRLFRDWESQAVRHARAVITRSFHAKRTLHARAGAGLDPDKIHVLPNAKDHTIFKPLEPQQRTAVRQKLGISDDALVLAYAGSLGPQYHPEEMLALFRLVQERHEDTHLLVMSGMQDVMHDLIQDLPESVARRISVMRCPPEDVAKHIAASDLGLSLREPSFSQQAVCPIKVVEYMLCGLPTVMIRGVGDLDERFQDLEGLYVVDDVTRTSLEQCASWCVKTLQPKRQLWSEGLRAHAIEEFGMDSVSAKLRALLMSR